MTCEETQYINKCTHSILYSMSYHEKRNTQLIHEYGDRSSPSFNLPAHTAPLDRITGSWGRAFECYTGGVYDHQMSYITYSAYVDLSPTPM